MSKAVIKSSPVQPISAESLSKVILHGDLKSLTPVEKVGYYNKVCEVVGLNPLTKPFDYITLNGKEVLYASKGCAEQLRSIYKVSLEIAQISTVSDVYVVVVRASMPDGRFDVGTGCVNVGNLKGEAMANAFMKCETKAKRRATLSICGLNMLDEVEVETIPGAFSPPAQTIPSAPPPAAPVILQKEAADPEAKTGSVRDIVAKEIVAAKKTLKMTNATFASYCENKFGHADFKKLTAPQMLDLRNDLQNDVFEMEGA